MLFRSDEHRVDMYANHYSVSIQQALPWRLTTQIGYVGNEGHHMLDRNNINLINPATGQRTLPQFGRVDIKGSGSSTNFNGLQVSLYRQATSGLQMGVQYMWSHSFDEGALGGGESAEPQNAACRHCEYGSTTRTSARRSRRTGSIGCRSAPPTSAGAGCSGRSSADGSCRVSCRPARGGR